MVDGEQSPSAESVWKKDSEILSMQVPAIEPPLNKSEDQQGSRCKAHKVIRYVMVYKHLYQEDTCSSQTLGERILVKTRGIQSSLYNFPDLSALVCSGFLCFYHIHCRTIKCSNI